VRIARPLRVFKTVVSADSLPGEMQVIGFDGLYKV